MTISNVVVACPATHWTGRPCRAWGAKGPHACKLLPKHDGVHVCPCGHQFAEADPEDES